MRTSPELGIIQGMSKSNYLEISWYLDGAVVSLSVLVDARRKLTALAQNWPPWYNLIDPHRLGVLQRVCVVVEFSNRCEALQVYIVYNVCIEKKFSLSFLRHGLVLKLSWASTKWSPSIMENFLILMDSHEFSCSTSKIPLTSMGVMTIVCLWWTSPGLPRNILRLSIISLYIPRTFHVCFSRSNWKMGTSFCSFLNRNTTL